MRRPTLRRLGACTLAAGLLAGCSSWTRTTEPLFGWLSPYRIDVQQGNVVTSEQMAQLKPGMTRLQVRDVLGTPLLSDTFHPGRWDYLFTLNQPGKPLQRRNIVLTFDGDRLDKIEAPELPSEREFVSAVARTGLPAISAALALSEEQIKALPVPPRPAIVPSEPTPTTRLYPPLEAP
jgi:outer membrane protein assembly factor BamE